MKHSLSGLRVREMGILRVAVIYYFIAGLVTLSPKAHAVNADMIYSQNLMSDLPLNEPIDPRRIGKKNAALLFGSIHVERQIEFADYDVDNLFSPQVNYRFNFNMILRNRTADGKSSELKDGTYLVRMVVLRPHLPEDGDPKKLSQGEKIRLLYDRYVAGFQGFAEVNQGLTRLPVNFHFHTLSAVSMRNTLLLQILPIKQKSLTRNSRGLISADSKFELENSPNYLTNVHRVFFIPKIPSVGTSTPAIVETDYNIEESLDLGAFMAQSENYIKMQHQFQNQNRESPSQIAKKFNLELLSIQSPWVDSINQKLPFKSSRAISSAQFSSIFEHFDRVNSTFPEDATYALCAGLQSFLTIDPRYLGGIATDKKKFDSQLRTAMFQRCFSRPEEALAIVRHIHPVTIEKNASYKQGQGFRIGLIENFGTNRVSSHDTVSSYQQNFNPIDVMGMLRFGYTYSVNETQSRQRFAGSVVSSAVDLQVQTWNMAVTLNQPTICLMVVPLRGDGQWIYAQKMKGLYICGEQKPTSMEVEETYFHIINQDQGTATIDLLDPKNQTNLILRGQRDFNAFLKGIEKFVSPVHNEKTNVGKASLIATQQSLAGLPSVPGVFSESIPLSGPRVEERADRLNSPTFWDRLFHLSDEKF